MQCQHFLMLKEDIEVYKWYDSLISNTERKNTFESYLIVSVIMNKC